MVDSKGRRQSVAKSQEGKSRGRHKKEMEQVAQGPGQGATSKLETSSLLYLGASCHALFACQAAGFGPRRAARSVAWKGDVTREPKKKKSSEGREQ